MLTKIIAGALTAAALTISLATNARADIGVLCYSDPNDCIKALYEPQTPIGAYCVNGILYFPS